MKNVLFYTAFLCSLFVSCNAQSQNGEGGENETAAKKNVSKRDKSITRAIAYSDLFMDSTAMEQFIASKKIPDTLARRIRSFYNTRNYQYAWFTSDGLTEQARGFWNLHDYHVKYNKDSTLEDKALEKKMDALMAEEELSVSASDKGMLNTELQMTKHFILYTLNNYEDGYVKRKEMERFVPRKREDALYLADSLLTKKHKDDKYFEDVNEPYKLLKEQLGRYYEIAKKGGWQPVTGVTKSLKKGTSSPAIVAIKRRLHLTGDLPVADTGALFNDTLEQAVRVYQERHGFKPDGIIDAALVKEMNVPVQQRIQQILINMGRMRWMPERPGGNLMLVNIPEFMLHVYEGRNKAFSMPVVVGKEGHNTTTFTGDLNQVVFSPHWNVPPSIVKKEILPAMERNPSYLASQNMEITGNEGGLPVIRQKPGPKNSLGKVKFLFPNSFDIYFHDTPAKSLFQQEKRAYSHGCIRLSDPYKMAQYVLRNQSEWTPEKIRAAMDAGQEKFVKLKEPIPVFITYYTAWVDEAGRLNFREDIYKHDQKLAAKMFTGAASSQIAAK